jgi:hypothetical protein
MMASTFPSGNEPFIFFDTLQLNSTDTSQTNLNQHAGAFNSVDFTAAVPAGTARLFVTFVVFAYPNATNSATTSPKAPIIEILKQGVSFDGPGLALHLTPDGTDALDLGAGRAVNYSYKGLGGGVFQIVFTPDNVPFDSIAWQIRFTINDGLTSFNAQTGLTFVVDGADTQGPWIAVPGQLNLPPTGPQPIDFAAALAGVTLAGPVTPPTGAPLMGGTTFRARLPIGNYGTGPLTLTAVTLTGAPGHFSARLTATPLAIPPGSVNAETVEVSYAAPAAGETREPSAAAIFALASNDPLAAQGGATAHFNTLSLFAEITMSGVVNSAPFNDKMSTSVLFDAAGGTVVFWDRVLLSTTGAVSQGFASRWDRSTGFSTPPQQVTSGGVNQKFPRAIVLPTGEIVVAYEMFPILQFRHAPLAALNAATDTPVSSGTTAVDLRPLPVVSGQQVVFFWQRKIRADSSHPDTFQWMYRRRQYTNDWSEAHATWLDGTDQVLATGGTGQHTLEFHAVVDNLGDIWAAFTTEDSQIQMARLTPGTGTITLFPAFSSRGSSPFVVIDGTIAVWVFWDTGTAIVSERFTRAINRWDDGPVAAHAPDDTGVGGTRGYPIVLRNAQGILLLLGESRGGSSLEMWFKPRDAVTNEWGEPRLLIPIEADFDSPFALSPFATIAPNSVVWLFWHSSRTGRQNIFFERIPAI